MKFIITEQDRLHIRNLYNTDDKEILSEGILSTLFSSMFKGFNKSIMQSIESSLKKVLDDVVLKGGGKTVTMSAIRNSANYKSALIQALEEACRAKYKMTFNELAKSPKYGTKAVDDLVKQVDDVFNQQLKETAKSTGKTIAADVRSSEKALTKAQTSVSNAGKKVGGKTVTPATKEELKALTKNWQQNTRLNQKVRSAQDAINRLKPITRKQVDEILKSAQKVTGNADTVIKPGSTSKTVKIPGGGFFRETATKLTKLPGKITKFVLKRAAVKSLIALGIGVTAIYLIYQSMYPDDTILLEDENGNDLQDGNAGDYAECIQELINNGTGKMFTSTAGEVSVKVVNDEYPDGIQFYPNGRVLDVKNQKMGSYTCVGGTPQPIKEQSTNTDQELYNDVERMIDLLDFPVTEQNLFDANALLEKYVSNGKGKQFLSLYQRSGLGKGDLRKTLNNISTVNARSVDSKNQMYNKINKIESNKVVSEDINEAETDNEIYNDVETMIDLLDFPVSKQNMRDANAMLDKYTSNGKGKQFLSLYQQSGWGGGDLSKSLRNITTSQAETTDLKQKMLGKVSNIQGGGSQSQDNTQQTGDGTQTGKKGDLSKIQITWDGQGGGGGGSDKTGGGGGTVKKSIYHDCDKKQLPHEFGCKSSIVKEVQSCIGLESKYHTGNFGPITKKKLTELGYDVTNGITQEMYDKIKQNCNSTTTTRKKVEPITTDKKEPRKPELKLMDRPAMDRPSTDLQGKIPSVMEFFAKKKLLNSKGEETNTPCLKGSIGDKYIKYKCDLDDSEYEMLNDYLVSNGYQYDKQRVKSGDKEKYRWVKSK